MDKLKNININCDLGEGMGNDAELMPYLKSCNIACGGHFGNAETMREAIKLAIQNDVKVGAHPSFPDKDNFGRKEMNIDPEALEVSIRQQVADFKSVCDELKAEMHHIKLHGALYNLAAKDEDVAKLVIRAFDQFAPVKLYAPYKSKLAELAAPIFEVCHEAFIDRRYQDDLSLVKRNDPMALIESSELAFNQLNTIVSSGEVESVSGKMIATQSDTFCIHSDNKNALEILEFIHQKGQLNG